MHTRWRTAGDVALVGLGATATMDLGGEAIRRATGVAPLDYALVGRWIGHMTHGQFTHDAIGAAAAIPDERKLGLLAHYSIGVALAGLLVACQPAWMRRPTPGPAMAMGLGSTIAPFAVMLAALSMAIA